MGDEPKPDTTAPVTPEPDEGDELGLASLLGEDDAIEEPEEPTEPEPEPELETPPPDTTSARLRELEMENAFLRGRAASATPEKPEGEEDDEDIAVDLDALRAGIDKDPAVAIANLVKQVTKGVRESTVRKVERVVQERVAQTTGAQQEHAADVREMLKLYPELETDSEFHGLATQIYQGLTKSLGQVPGLQTLAAGMAHSRLVKMGKTPKGSAAPAAKPRLVPPKKTAAPLVRGTAKPDGNAQTDPLEGFSASERAVAMKVCRSYGITPAQFRKNYDASKKEDPGYGRVA